jgi:hypothetical protein
MITTREFVNVAAWHLFTDSALLARYRFAEEADRLAMLQEILRLEPMVGRLRRRTTTSIEVPGAEGVVTVPAGELVEIVLGVANATRRRWERNHWPSAPAAKALTEPPPPACPSATARTSVPEPTSRSWKRTSSSAG